MKLPFRILVVEDDPGLLSQVVEQLRDAQYVVTGATTTDAAKRLLAATSYDLLITDGPIGPLTGRTVGGMPHAEPPEMALMVIASNDNGALEAEARRYGATFVRGPLRAGELLATVRRCLQSVRRRRRWARKRVAGGFRVLAHGVPAAVLDLSYGGLRLEVPRVSHLPEAFDIEIAGIGLHLQVETVWMTRSDDGLMLVCGASLSGGGTPAARTWRAIVDRLAA